jgi:hypothetical protein
MRSAKVLSVWVLVLVLSVGLSGQVAADNGRGPTGQFVREAVKLLLKDHTYTESAEMLFDVKSGGALSLGTTNGSIRVATWEKEKIRLVITKTARASCAFDAKALLAKFLVQTKCEGKDLHLVAKAQTKECKETVGVTFTVWVPRSYNVDIKTEAGSIDIGRLNGKFSAHTNDGKITLDYNPDDGLDIEVEDRTADENDVDSATPVREESPGSQDEDSTESSDEDTNRADETDSPATGIGEEDDSPNRS